MARSKTGNKRQAILDAALDLFMQQGCAKTTMQQIARASGLAVGTLYLYYKDKDDVIAACADAFAQEHLQEAQNLVTAPGSAPEILKGYLLNRFRKWQRVSDGSPQAAELAQAILRLRPERIADFEILFVQTLAQLIQRGIEEKVFKAQDAETTARVLALSVAIFFPFPGGEDPRKFTEAEFLVCVEWFLEVGLVG